MAGSKNVSEQGVIIGQNLRALREKARLSQSDVAEFLNISYQQVQKYEAGINRIPLQILPMLCDLFGAPVETMFAGTVPGAVRNHEDWRDLQLSFARIDNAALRRKIVQVVDILAS